MRLTITVLAVDIYTTNYSDPCGCAIHEAVKRFFPEAKITVMPDWVYLYDKATFKIPPDKELTLRNMYRYARKDKSTLVSTEPRDFKITLEPFRG